MSSEFYCTRNSRAIPSQTIDRAGFTFTFSKKLRFV